MYTKKTDFATVSKLNCFNIVEMKEGHYTILFSSPETLQTSKFEDLLAEENFNSSKLISIAFDEVHTLIEYYKFRPAYEKQSMTEIVNNITSELTYHLLTATINKSSYKEAIDQAGLSHITFKNVIITPDRQV